MNVGALPETLLESELFGHEKGAFTGAAERRIGRFELAHGGTLFLDEIGDIPPATQVKLLRVLESREFTRVGGTQTIQVDVRVVAATNRPLREQVEDGTFRADLYYRLNVLRVYLPPLAGAAGGHPAARARLRARAVARARPARSTASPAEAMQTLQRYGWPGNVRELRNLIESMVVLAPGREIGEADIPPGDPRGRGRGRGCCRCTCRRRCGRTRRGAGRAGAGVHPAQPGGAQAAGGGAAPAAGRGAAAAGGVGDGGRARGAADRRVAGRSSWRRRRAGRGSAPGLEAPEAAPAAATIELTAGMTMAEIERLAIEATLRQTRGNRRRAAELLGIGERTLYRKLREYQPGDEAGEDD